MENELFICQCDNVEHQLIFSYFDDLDDGEVYVSIHLNPKHGIFKRIKYAIKYIFGYRSKYGDFDEFIFKNEDVHKLEKIVNFMKLHHA